MLYLPASFSRMAASFSANHDAALSGTVSLSCFAGANALSKMISSSVGIENSAINAPAIACESMIASAFLQFPATASSDDEEADAGTVAEDAEGEADAAFCDDLAFPAFDAAEACSAACADM